MGWNQLATKDYVDGLSHTDTVSSLTDTTIASVGDDEVLQYDSGAWHNQTLAEAGIHPLTVVGIGDGNLLAANDQVADNDWLRINSTEVEGVSNSELIAALDLEAGVDLQAYSVDLAAIDGLTNADGAFIVGSGGSAGNWVAEDGNTARTSLGLGTTNTPQFTGLTLTGADGFEFASDGVVKSADVTASNTVSKTMKLKGGSGKSGTDVAGGICYIEGGDSTGDALGGSIVMRVTPSTNATGTIANTPVTALTIATTKQATFEAGVTVKGDLDVQGTTTTINSANTTFTDTSIQLNVADGEAAFGDSASVIVFGDSTGATSTGRIINTGTAAAGFKFMDGNTTNTPTGNNNSGDGVNYVNVAVNGLVLDEITAPNPVINGMLYFDGTNVFIGTD